MWNFGENNKISIESFLKIYVNCNLVGLKNHFFSYVSFYFIFCKILNIHRLTFLIKIGIDLQDILIAFPFWFQKPKKYSKGLPKEQYCYKKKSFVFNMYMEWNAFFFMLNMVTFRN